MARIKEPFLVHVALTQDDYTQGWQQLGSADSPPAVDFATEVAIYLGMAGSSSCPANFQHLVVDDAAAHVYAQWDDPFLANRPCTDDLAPQGVALAVSRSVLPAGRFTLTLRSDLICLDCPDHPDQTVVTVR